MGGSMWFRDQEVRVFDVNAGEAVRSAHQRCS